MLLFKEIPLYYNPLLADLLKVLLANNALMIPDVQLTTLESIASTATLVRPAGKSARTEALATSSKPETPPRPSSASAPSATRIRSAR